MEYEIEKIPPLPTPNTKEWRDRIYYERIAEGEYIAYDILTNKAVSATKGLMDLYGCLPEVRKQWIYHEGLIDHICTLMVEKGKALPQILKDEKELPPLSTVMRWKRTFPAVQEKLEEAREMMAELAYDRIHRSVNDEVPEAPHHIAWEKLNFDRLKFLAGVDAPNRFGNKTQITGDKKAPVQFVISTGIDRGEDHGTGSGFERKQRICGDDRGTDGQDGSSARSGFEAEEDD